MNAALLSKLPYHPVNDFTPITQLTAAGLLLVVHPSAPVAFARIISSLVHINTGKRRALAVSTAKRVPALPETPTLTEAGVPVTVVNWYG